MTTLLISEIMPPKVGGTARWFWELYRRFPRREYLIAAGEDPRQEKFDRSHDVRVVRLPLTLSDPGMCSWRGLRGYSRALRAVGRVVKSRRILALHGGRCVPEGWIALLLKCWRGLPYLCYVHGEEVKREPSATKGGPMASRQLRWMTRVVLQGAKSVIANSRSSARIVEEEWRLPGERVRVLYPGVDTGYFAPAERDAAARARLGWGDRPVVLTVGRLQKRKGHDQMIHAVGLLRRAIPDVLYAIAGEGEERGPLEELVARGGLDRHVQFRGEVEDRELLDCYQQCDLFVLPNRQVGRDIEGFGIVLLEAQACGKPVIAGASGGTAEAIRIPESGLVIPCHDPREIAAAVGDLFDDRNRRERMGEAARRWTVERFGWAEVSERARQIFAEGRASTRSAGVAS